MEYMFSPFVVAVVAIIGSFTYSIVRSLANARVRELEVRERIAMIERGLVPPPEKDPEGFDRAMSRHSRIRDDDEDDWDWHVRRRSPARFRSAGVTLMGIGFGLMLMITVLGGREAGIGVGGFLVVLGLAFFVNAWLTKYDAPPPRSRYPGSDKPPVS